jgi:hypothetical protein
MYINSNFYTFTENYNSIIKLIKYKNELIR